MIWWFILAIYNNEHGISDAHLFNQTSANAAVQMQFVPQTHTGKKKVMSSMVSHHLQYDLKPMFLCHVSLHHLSPPELII